VTPYPEVVSEWVTLAAVINGRSLARYGDGELNLCRGGSAKLQQFHPELGARLRGILRDAGECAVAIPNVRSETPKAPFWSKYLSAVELLEPSHRYYSSFVTRPDSAPWIDTPEYWDALQNLWLGYDVTLVRGSEKSLTAADMVGARVTEVIAPARQAWDEYPSLLERIGTPARAILCLGPTATVLAVDLCAKGVHAIDLGHCGMFLRKHRAGEPMTVTAADRVAV